jgi:hypothetical protein
MSTKERKPRRTLDQDFIDGAVMLVTQERYKNPRDRAMYLGAIDHIDTPMVRSAVPLVGQPCWVTVVVDGTEVPKTLTRTAPRTLRANLNITQARSLLLDGHQAIRHSVA